MERVRDGLVLGPVGGSGRDPRAPPPAGPLERLSLRTLFSREPLAPLVAVVTVELLTEAIRNTLVTHGKIPPERAEPLARLVLNYFGTEETLLDNVISGDDRDAFYLLEEQGLLASEEEDALVAKGRTWRIHYWLLRRSTIEAAARPPPVAPPDEAREIYAKMPADGWAHGSNDPGDPPPRTVAPPP
jgi:hypothetical protein